MSDEYTQLRHGYAQSMGNVDETVLDYAEEQARALGVKSFPGFGHLVASARREAQRTADDDRQRAINESHQRARHALRENLSPYEKLKLANRSQ